MFSCAVSRWTPTCACARFSDSPPGCWLRVQLAYDLRATLHAIGPKIKAEIQLLQAA